MLLERTLSQLDIGHLAPEPAQMLGHLGYVQWLGSLCPDLSYASEARRALRAAAPFRAGSPAVEVFAGLIEESLARPLLPLGLSLATPGRRGGAAGRRRVH